MNWFFAQAQAIAMDSTSDSGESLGIWIVGMIGLTIVASLWLANVQFKRAHAHAERMQALSLGLVVPPEESAWAKATVCSLIGFGVPMLSFGFTASLLDRHQDYSSVLWIAPSLVSGLSVLGATLLAAKLFGRKTQGVEALDINRSLHASQGWSNSKPSIDPDAYDVSASRGG